MNTKAFQFLLKAFYYDIRKNREKALRYFEKAQSPNSLSLFRQGALYLKQKKFAAALKSLEQVQGPIRRMPSFNYKIGCALEGLNRKQEALHYLSLALKAHPGRTSWVIHLLNCEPDLVLYQELLGKNEAERFHNSALPSYKASRWYMAIPSLEHALKLQPRKAQWWFELGCCYEGLERFEAAAEAFAKAKSRGCHEKDLLYRLGWCLWQCGKFEEARDAFAKQGSDSASGADLHAKNKHWGRVILALEHEQREGTAFSDHERFLLGKAYALCCRPEDALETLVSVRAPNEFPGCFHLMGQCHERLNQWGSALQAYERALEAGENPALRYRMGCCHRQAGQYKEACAHFSLCLDCAPLEEKSLDELEAALAVSDDAALWHSKGMLLSRNGRHEEACTAFLNVRNPDESSLHEFDVPRLAGWQHRNSLYLRYRSELPLQERAVFYESFLGNTMSCSPFALFKYLYEHDDYKDFVHVWPVKDEAVVPPQYRHAERVILVQHGSNAYLRYLATCKYLVNNVTFPSWFFPREEQVYMNTWHGTPLKSLGDANQFDRFCYGNVSRNFLQASWLIQPNTFTSDVMLDLYHVRNILPGQNVITGYPRQDLMLGKSQAEKAALRQTIFGEDDGRPILLYAPTWRDYAGFEEQEADTRQVLAVLINSPYRILFKGHQFLESAFRNLGLPTPPPWLDTNELLSIVDVLVTDYSSIGMDFLASGKPTIYHVEDVEAYRKGRGLLVEPEQFPGHLSRSLDELKALLSAPLPPLELTEWQKDIIRHDDGHACERAATLLLKEKPVPAPRQKPAMLFYPGTFLPNGIFSVLCNLLKGIAEDVDIYILSDKELLDAPAKQELMQKLPGSVHILPYAGGGPKSFEEDYLFQQWEKNNGFCSPQHESTVLGMFGREFQRCFGKARFDAVVNYEGYNLWWSAFFAMAGRHCPRHVIVTHSNMYEEYRHRFRYLARIFHLYRSYSNVLCVSKATCDINKAELSDRFGLPEDLFLHVDNLLDIAPILEGASQPLPEEDADLLNGTPTFLTLGRLSVEKDHAKLIRAFAGVVKDFPQARLVILGDGALKMPLLGLIEELGLQEHVRLPGFRKNPFAYLAKADCFVLSSNHEGQPMVLLEATALGRPIIATDIPASRGMLEGTNAILAPNSAEDLEKAMKQACHTRHDANVFDFKSYNRQCVQLFYERCGITLPKA